MLGTAIVVAGSLVLVGSAPAGWRPPAGTGSGGAMAKTLPAGSTPSASVPLLSTTVTVSWAGATFGGGAAVPGYVVTRYDALGNAQAAANGCGGVVSGTSCVETGVPAGSWGYTVTPAAGAWRGGESARSPAVTVPGT